MLMIAPARYDGVFRPIFRERVVRRILQAAAHPVALIVAPAGYGKSVALRQALERLDTPWVRFDIRSEHATLLGFTRGLADALIDVLPDMRASLTDTRLGHDPNEIAEWAGAHLSEFTGIIALDDFQYASIPLVNELLEILVGALKGRVRWVIASRTMPEFPVASWIAYGDMDLVVDQCELAFTLDEAHAASCEAGANELDVDRVVELTAGWPTAVGFAVRSGVRTPDIAAVTASTRELAYQYLAEQVYQQFSTAERELLHAAAFLPTIDVRVLKAAGFTNAHSMLESLRRRVAFLTAESDATYRCHDLFREFLVNELMLKEANAANVLRERLGAALELCDDPVHALEQYIAGQNGGRIQTLLSTLGLDLIEGGHLDIVERSLAAVPSNVADEGAVLTGLRAEVEWAAGNYTRAEALHSRALERMSGSAKLQFSLRLAIRSTTLQRDVRPLLEPLLQANLNLEDRAEILSVIAFSDAQAGDPAAVLRAIDDLERLPFAFDAGRVRARVLHRLAGALILCEEKFERIGSILDESERLAVTHRAFRLAAWIYILRSHACVVYRGDYNGALRSAESALECAQKAGDRMPLQTAWLQVAVYATRFGDSERALGAIAAVRAIPTGDAARMKWISSTCAALAAWNSDFEKADAWMTDIAALGYGCYLYDICYTRATHAVYLAAAGRKDAASSLATATLLSLDTAMPSLWGMRLGFETAKLLCAATEIILGRYTSARRILRTSQCSDLQNQILRETLFAAADCYANERNEPVVFEKLKALADSGLGGVSRTLSAAFGKLFCDRLSASPLTNAELEIVRWLDHGYSPKEIADETRRSVHTVRTLIQRAISKMGCSSRQQAIAKLRYQGLLEDRPGIKS